MDNPVSDAYLPSMFARFVTMLAIVAITFVTTVTSAHAARMSMSAAPDHSVHVGEMMQAPDNSELSCDGEQHCGSADAGMCEFVCAGLSVFLPSPSGDADHGYSPAGHDLPSGAILASQAPGLNERPPKLRLL